MFFLCFFLFLVFRCCFWKLVTSVATNDTPRDNKEPEGLPPNSNTVFKENDDVVFFAETKYINKLEKLLSTY